METAKSLSKIFLESMTVYCAAIALLFLIGILKPEIYIRAFGFLYLPSLGSAILLNSYEKK